MRRFTALLLTALCLVALISCVCNVETETPAPVKEVDASSQLEATGTLETTQETSVKLMLKDAAGAPIQNAVVECYLDSQRIGSLKTDAQGEALFDKLIPGTYSFKVKAEGYKDAELADVKVDTNSKLAIEVKAEPVTAVVTEPEVVVVTEPEEVVVTEPEIITDMPDVETIMPTDEIAPQLPVMAEYDMGGYSGKTSIGSVMAAPGGAYPNANLVPTEDWNTEEFSAITPNIFHSPLTEPLSTFSIDVDTASYSTIRRYLNQNQLPPANAIRTEEVINYFSYDYPQPKGEHPFSVYTEMGVCPWNQKRNLVHIGLQGRDLDMASAPASNLVFLLDVSGSMDDPNKLPLVKESMKLLVQNMREQDRVAIVVYAGAAGLVLPSTSGDQKAKIVAALDNLQAGGSTAGGAGIKLAYSTALENMLRGGNNRVILCSDGDFNVGVSSTNELQQLVEDNRGKGIYLTILGFGMGNYKDNRMEILADKGNGNYAYIDNLMEAKKVLVNEMTGTLFTIAKDVKLQVEFNPAHVKAYRLIGYENRMLNAEDFRDDTKDAGEMGAGHTVTALYEIIPTASKEDIPGVDPLKYQDIKISEEAQKSPEVMNVKLRYKPPLSDESIPLETPVYNKTLGMEDVSETFMWSAAAAGYAMLLQKSEHAAALNWNMLMEWAQSNIGEDKDGYRKEFLDLIKLAAKLSSVELD